MQFGCHALDIFGSFTFGHLGRIDGQASLMGGDMPLLDFSEALDLILQQGINLAPLVGLTRRLRDYDNLNLAIWTHRAAPTSRRLENDAVGSNRV